MLESAAVRALLLSLAAGLSTLLGALVVFATTYIPLMYKFLHVVVQARREEELAAQAEE